MKQRDRLALAVVALLGLCVIVQYGGLAPWLRYSRAAVADGEVWRLVTGHLAHLSGAHLLLNGLGTVLVAALVGHHLRPGAWGAALLWCALVIGLGLWWALPELQWYVGLSGVLHGLLIAGAIAALGDRRERLLAGVVIVVVGMKLAWEHIAGAMPGTATIAGGPVVVEAHLFGAIGGAVAGLAILIRRALCHDDAEQSPGALR